MAETLRDYLPGKPNELGHTIQRADKEIKQKDVYFASLQVLWFFCKIIRHPIQ